ncbi:MAG: cysteine desulfurase family protein [Candidatus Diapherotrites archaeon]|nr:cysteine desulfurase family protein [Candidatus Diapherotrites archaeon]
MKEIYLDFAATTFTRPEVLKAMNPFFTRDFGNPSSLHNAGLKAKKALADSRQKVAGIIGARPEEVIFTGSGTESINLAIKGVARALKKQGKGNHIITSKIEHHAVLDSCRFLQENEGFEITYLSVDKYGTVDLEELSERITSKTILISIMYANNEIGTIQPIHDIAKIARESNVLFHTDACQAGFELDVNVQNLGVDLMTLNGSKIYGPKGTGMLFVKKGTPIQAIIQGGGQERGLRSGTENVPGIVGFAKALEICQKQKSKEAKRQEKLRDYFIKKLKKIPGVVLNGHPTERLPNNVNVSIMGIEGEAMLLRLNELGVCASSGSACTSTSLDPSHVILATGVSFEQAHGSLRFSLGLTTTKKDLDFIMQKLPKIVKDLRQLSPVDFEKLK